MIWVIHLSLSRLDPPVSHWNPSAFAFTPYQFRTWNKFSHLVLCFCFKDAELQSWKTYFILYCLLAPLNPFCPSLPSWRLASLDWSPSPTVCHRLWLPLNGCLLSSRSHCISLIVSLTHSANLPHCGTMLSSLGYFTNSPWLLFTLPTALEVNLY